MTATRPIGLALFILSAAIAHSLFYLLGAISLRDLVEHVWFVATGACGWYAFDWWVGRIRRPHVPQWVQDAMDEPWTVHEVGESRETDVRS